MEVHQHAHTARKKRTHYLWEFFYFIDKKAIHGRK